MVLGAAALIVDCRLAARRPRHDVWAPRCCGRLSSPTPRSRLRRHRRRRRRRHPRRCRHPRRRCLRKSCRANPGRSWGPNPSVGRRPVANPETPSRERRLSSGRNWQRWVFLLVEHSITYTSMQICTIQMISELLPPKRSSTPALNKNSSPWLCNYMFPNSSSLLLISSTNFWRIT